MVRAWLRTGLALGCWPNLLWDKKPQGEGLEDGEDGALPLPSNQEHKDSRSKVLPGEQGLGEGGLLLYTGVRNQESIQVLLTPSWLWNQSLENLFFRVCLSKNAISPHSQAGFFPNWFLSPAESLWRKFWDIKSCDALNAFPNPLVWYTPWVIFLLWNHIWDAFVLQGFYIHVISPHFWGGGRVKNDLELVLWHQVEKFLIQVKLTLKDNVVY